jgi:hypothetical protein
MCSHTEIISLVCRGDISAVDGDVAGEVDGDTEGTVDLIVEELASAEEGGGDAVNEKATDNSFDCDTVGCLEVICDEGVDVIRFSDFEVVRSNAKLFAIRSKSERFPGYEVA